MSFCLKHSCGINIVDKDLAILPNNQNIKIMPKGKKIVELHRSSVTGRFVTEHYAKSHPKTTQTEHRQKKK